MGEERASFFIKYEGPVLDNNEMDINELAPALLAVADLFEEANTVFNKGSTKITVSVKGSFKSGSFGIDFSVLQDIYQQVINFFDNDGVRTAVDILELLGFSAVGFSKGLIHLIKKLKNRKIKSIKNDDEREVSIIVSDDDGTLQEIKTSKDIFLLFKNLRIRKAIEQIIRDPLSKDGITKFVIIDPNEDKTEIIEKSEKQYFNAPDVNDEFLTESVSETYLQIVALSFKEGNKWRFSRGENQFYATIEDQNFLRRVENNERFSKDDILKVRLRTKEFLTAKGLTVEYFVEEILEHRSAARQMQLPIEEK